MWVTLQILIWFPGLSWHCLKSNCWFSHSHTTSHTEETHYKEHSYSEYLPIVNTYMSQLVEYYVSSSAYSEQIHMSQLGGILRKTILLKWISDIEKNFQCLLRFLIIRSHCTVLLSYYTIYLHIWTVHTLSTLSTYWIYIQYAYKLSRMANFHSFYFHWFPFILPSFSLLLI